VRQVWNPDAATQNSGRCTYCNNPREPGGHTWGDNWFCSIAGVASLGMEFSNNGAIAGKKCLWVGDSLRPNGGASCTYAMGCGEPQNWPCGGGYSGTLSTTCGTWFCIHPKAPYNLVWSETGQLPNKGCIAWREGCVLPIACLACRDSPAPRCLPAFQLGRLLVVRHALFVL
jgi:hypothetical protein